LTESVDLLLPVHPDDRPFLEMKWRDSLYVDAALVFWLRKAPQIFNVLVDVLK